MSQNSPGRNAGTGHSGQMAVGEQSPGLEPHVWGKQMHMFGTLATGEMKRCSGQIEDRLQRAPWGLLSSFIFLINILMPLGSFRLDLINSYFKNNNSCDILENRLKGGQITD